LLLLVAKNASRFVISNEIHTINTRQSINLYLPSVNLSKCKNGYKDFQSFAAGYKEIAI
jgi:hypothetical protein